MASKLGVVRIADVDLRLGVTLEATVRQRPGEQEYEGETDAAPDPAALRAQLVDRGFVVLSEYVVSDTQGFSLVARRASADVTINFSGAPWNVLSVNALDHDAIPAVEVTNGTFEWGGVQLPVYFANGKIAADAPQAFIVEASVKEGIDPVEHYRRWARDGGFEIEDEEPAPDAVRSLRFRVANIQVVLQTEEDRLTLFLAPVI